MKDVDASPVRNNRALRALRWSSDIVPRDLDPARNGVVAQAGVAVTSQRPRCTR